MTAAELIKELRNRNVPWSVIIAQVLTTDEVENALTYYYVNSATDNTLFCVCVTTPPEFAYDGDYSKIGYIKEVRRVTGCGLKEAKDFVEGFSLNMTFACAAALDEYFRKTGGNLCYERI